jgi:hypothetical protein
MTTRRKTSTPPDALPIYRILKGPDGAAFCHRVSTALALGYELYGSPAATFDGRHVVVAQAMIWPGTRPSIAKRPSPKKTAARTRSRR